MQVQVSITRRRLRNPSPRRLRQRVTRRRRNASVEPEAEAEPATSRLPHAPLKGRAVPAGSEAGPDVILLVDDETDILESIRLVLENAMPDVRVVTASSGREALHALGRESVSLIIADYKMPGMDGLVLLTEARKLRPEVQRVLYTAFASDDLRRLAHERAQVHQFLSKGTSPLDLVDTVRRLLR